MAAEHYLPITQPLLHVPVCHAGSCSSGHDASVLPRSVARGAASAGHRRLHHIIPRKVVLLARPRHPGPRPTTPVWPWNFSGLGHPALGLYLHCDILSGLLLLQAWLNYMSVKEKKCEQTHISSSSTWATSCCSLHVEVMVQLAAITVISLLC